MSIRIKILILITITAVLAVLYNFTPLGEMVDLVRLLEQKDSLLIRVKENIFLSSLVFVTLYILAVSLSIPGATVLSLLGGFLFGPFIGVILINFGATIGALIIFLAARYFLGQDVQKKYADRMALLNKEVEKNGRSYFLTVRLIPLFPFFLINLLAGFTTLPARTFLWTTSLGIIPGSFVYAYLGSTGANTGEGSSFAVQITIGLVLLGLLSLLPVVVKKFNTKKEVTNEED